MRAICFSASAILFASSAFGWGTDRVVYWEAEYPTPPYASIASSSAGDRYVLFSTWDFGEGYRLRGLRSVDSGQTWQTLFARDSVYDEILGHDLCCVKAPDTSYLMFAIQKHDTTRDSSYSWVYYADLDWNVVDSFFIGAFRGELGGPFDTRTVLESGRGLHPWNWYDYMLYRIPVWGLYFVSKPSGTQGLSLPGVHVDDERVSYFALEPTRGMPDPDSARLFVVYSLDAGNRTVVRFTDDRLAFSERDTIPNYWTDVGSVGVGGATGADNHTLLAGNSVFFGPYWRATAARSLDAGETWLQNGYLPDIPGHSVFACDIEFVMASDLFIYATWDSTGGIAQTFEYDRATLTAGDSLQIQDASRFVMGSIEIDVVEGTSTVWTAYCTAQPIFYDEMTLPVSVPAEPVLPSYKRLVAAPNPFNARTVFSFAVENASEAWVDVYDVLGRKVAELGRAFYPSGQYEVPWDAGGLPSGLYVAVLRTQDGITASTKVTLLK